MNKKLVTSGLLAGLVAGAGAGLVLQSSGFAGASSASSALPAVVVQTDDTTGSTDSSTDDSTDSSTDSSTDRAAERTARLNEILQPLVDDGTLTTAQRDAVVAALEAAGPLGGRGDHGGRGGRGDGLGRGVGMETAAEALGVTTDELRTALQDGQTLAEVAAAEGVEVQSVIDALVLAAGTHLSEHVADGDLTQEEADARLAEITTRITDMVNNGAPFGGRGDGMGRHGGDDDGDASGTTDSTDTSATTSA